MAFFSERELLRLLEIAQAPCISLYMPTHHVGSESQQDSIRLKNLLSQAEQQLSEKTDLLASGIEKMMSKAWTLVENDEFWKHQDNGLAIFITQEHTLTYRLPSSFEEDVIIDKQFYICPLVPLLSGNGEYYILAMSQNNVRLFNANRDRIHQIEVDGLTTSLAETLNFDTLGQSQQMHQANSVIYHSQGSGHDQKNENILRFCQQVNRDLASLFSSTHTPLVFVGVDYLFPIYQKANSYSHLHDEFIATNPDQLQDSDLQQLTWPLVQKIFESPITEAINDYHDRLHTSQTTSNLLEILSAAHDGQVETLLVAKDQKIQGRFNARERQLNLASDPSTGDTDLYNLAAIYTLFCRGKVYLVDREALPNSKPLSAILRYPIHTPLASHR